MWTSILTALINGVISFFLGRLAKADADHATRELGRLQAERDQAIAGRDAAERIAAEAVKPVTEDDAIARLERGEG